MRYEKLMSLLKFADRQPIITAVGDWAYDENNKRGPLVKTITDGIAAGTVAIDPSNRLYLTDAGFRKLYKVGGNVRITVSVPQEREAEFRRIVADFLR
jgi:hypothetical protein